MKSIFKSYRVYAIFSILLAVLTLVNLLPSNVFAQNAYSTPQSISQDTFPVSSTVLPLTQTLISTPTSTPTPTPSTPTPNKATPKTPTVITVVPTTNITTNSANLRGSLTDLGLSVKVQTLFAYGLSTNYGSSSTTQDMTATGNFSINIQGLTPNTIYHYQVRAINVTGEARGADVTFTTLSEASATLIITPTPTPTPSPVMTPKPTPTPTPTTLTKTTSTSSTSPIVVTDDAGG